ncbi:hypothetical protein AY599_04955, partial [Leptolyngbya valderiana BDU 20041]
MKITTDTIFQVSGAMLICAVAIALCFGLLSGSMQIAPLVLVVALVHLLPAALLFSLLAWLNRINLFSCVASGVLIASVPAGILTFPMSISGSSFNAWSGGRPTVVNGMPTLAGWIDYVQLLGVFGAIGAAAGGLFWLLIKNRFVASSSDKNRSVRNSEESSFSSWWMPIIAALMIAGVFISPSMTKDRSCHNVLRDGRNFAAPSLNAELAISRDEWRDLEAFYEQFATSNGLDFKSVIDHFDGSVSTLYLSMCSEPGLVIKSNKQHWEHLGGGPVPDRGVSVTIFSLEEEIDWIPISRRLFSALEQRWPGQI